MQMRTNEEDWDPIHDPFESSPTTQEGDRPMFLLFLTKDLRGTEFARKALKLM
jgi:hypothetical protein